MEDAEQEYVEAKAAYDAALARLVAARKARPKQPTRAELRRLENQRIADAVWLAYLGGNRNHEALAEACGCARWRVKAIIRDNLRDRRFWPETLDEYNERMWWLNYHRDRAERLLAQRDAMIEEGRRMSLEPGRSEAWMLAYRAFEKSVQATAQEC